MTAEQLLIEVRRAIEAGDPETPAVRKKLARIVNRPGAAELLAQVLRTGDLFQAHVAALALPFAKSELVRRALQRAAREAQGERRAAMLAALTEDELEGVLADSQQGLGDDLVQAAGMLAVNNPRDFVELLCEGTPIVDERVVEHVERVRAAFGIGAASLYGPLLLRRLTSEARRQVVRVLGHEPGDEVARLLEREQGRAAKEEQMLVRRERMRQASLSIQNTEPVVREGGGLLAPLGPSDSATLEIFEQLSPGRLLRTTLLLESGGSVDAFATPLEGEAEEVMRDEQRETFWARLSLGQVRTLIEGLPARRRAGIAPLCDRLSSVPSQPLPAPTPGDVLSMEEAHRLVRDPAWRDWRPLLNRVTWSLEALEETAHLSPGHFPDGAHDVAQQAQAQLAHAFAQRGTAARLSAGLRHMALVMHLRGDARAGAIAAESLWVARRRVSPVLRALTERELRLQLWAYGRLPQAYRDEVRAALRSRITQAKARWTEVQLLDLAQAAAEGLARDAEHRETIPGLPPVEALDLELAVRVAIRAQDSFRDPQLCKQARAGALDVIGDAARTWVEEGSVSAAFEVAQFATTTCFGSCPHRCFERPLRTSADRVFRGDCPGDEDL